jgi:hypothetical protein
MAFVPNSLIVLPVGPLWARVPSPNQAFPAATVPGVPGGGDAVSHALLAVFQWLASQFPKPDWVFAMKRGARP